MKNFVKMFVIGLVLLFTLGNTTYSVGKKDLSDVNTVTIEEYNVAIKNATNDLYLQAELYSYRALKYMFAGNYNMAINDSNKAIAIGFDKSKYDFVEWALIIYWIRGYSYFELQNYSAAITDFNTYIQKTNAIHKYWSNSQTDLLLANCYYLRVVAELQQYPLYRSKADGKIVRYANIDDNMLRYFNDLEIAIKIYSNLDLPQGQQRAIQTKEYLNYLKTAYYK